MSELFFACEAVCNNLLWGSRFFCNYTKKCLKEKRSGVVFNSSVDLVVSFVMFTLTVSIVYLLQKMYSKKASFLGVGFGVVIFFKDILISVTEITVSYAKTYNMCTFDALAQLFSVKIRNSVLADHLTMVDVARKSQKFYSLFSIHAYRPSIGYDMQVEGQIC